MENTYHTALLQFGKLYVNDFDDCFQGIFRLVVLFGSSNPEKDRAKGRMLVDNLVEKAKEHFQDDAVGIDVVRRYAEGWFNELEAVLPSE